MDPAGFEPASPALPMTHTAPGQGWPPQIRITRSRPIELRALGCQAGNRTPAAPRARRTALPHALRHDLTLVTVPPDHLGSSRQAREGGSDPIRYPSVASRCGLEPPQNPHLRPPTLATWRPSAPESNRHTQCSQGRNRTCEPLLQRQVTNASTVPGLPSGSRLRSATNETA